jgi:hypothetical protein
VTRRVSVVACLDCSRDLDHCHDAWLLVDEVCADPDCRLPIEAHAVVLEP